MSEGRKFGKPEHSLDAQGIEDEESHSLIRDEKIRDDSGSPDEESVEDREEVSDDEK